MKVKGGAEAKFRAFPYSELDGVVRFQVLKAASMMTAVWDIALFSLVEVNRRFRGAYCLHHQDVRQST
jgi:hypothetical protein